MPRRNHIPLMSKDHHKLIFEKSGKNQTMYRSNWTKPSYFGMFPGTTLLTLSMNLLSSLYGNNVNNVYKNLKLSNL